MTSLCVRVSSKPGTAIRRPTPPVQMISFSARSRGPRSVSIVCGSTKRAAPHPLVDRHAERVHPLTQGRARADIADDLSDASEQLVVLQGELADRDAVSRQVTRLLHQPGRIRQGAHRHGSVVRGHAAELRAAHECRPSAQVRRTYCGEYPRRSRADHDDVHHLRVSGSIAAARFQRRGLKGEP